MKCEECGHAESFHYPDPTPITGKKGKVLYEALGCMKIDEEGIEIPGSAFKRCPCSRYRGELDVPVPA